jgi:hypothetical protein
MCRIPNLLGDETRSGCPIKKAGIAEIDRRLRNMALSLHRNGPEADQHCSAQKLGHVISHRP